MFQILKDAFAIALKLRCRSSFLLGIALFVIFYYLVPFFLFNYQPVDKTPHSAVAGVIDGLVDGFKWLGWFMLGIFWLSSAYNYSKKRWALYDS